MSPSLVHDLLLREAILLRENGAMPPQNAGAEHQHAKPFAQGLRRRDRSVGKGGGGLVHGPSVPRKAFGANRTFVPCGTEPRDEGETGCLQAVPKGMRQKRGC